MRSGIGRSPRPGRRSSSATATPVESGLTSSRPSTSDFSGFGGTTVKGWLHLPAGAPEPLPAVVEFVGYGGGRGLPHERVMWSLAGYAHFVMDTRGQGSNWFVGGTPDPDPVGAPSQPGFMTRGILDPNHYYYRRVFVDGVRAVEAARDHPAVDRQRVAVTGGSQGGGISLAVAVARPGHRGRHGGRTVPDRLSRGRHPGRHQSLRGDHPVPESASRPCRGGVSDARRISTSRSSAGGRLRLHSSRLA